MADRERSEERIQFFALLCHTGTVYGPRRYRMSSISGKGDRYTNQSEKRELRLQTRHPQRLVSVRGRRCSTTSMPPTARWLRPSLSLYALSEGVVEYGLVNGESAQKLAL